MAHLSERLKSLNAEVAGSRMPGQTTREPTATGSGNKGANLFYTGSTLHCPLLRNSKCLGAHGLWFLAKAVAIRLQIKHNGVTSG